MPHYFIKRTRTFNYAQTHKNFNLSWSQKEPPERPLCSIQLQFPISLPPPLAPLFLPLLCVQFIVSKQMRKAVDECAAATQLVEEEAWVQDILWRIMRTN